MSITLQIDDIVCFYYDERAGEMSAGAKPGEGRDLERRRRNGARGGSPARKNAGLQCRPKRPPDVAGRLEAEFGGRRIQVRGPVKALTHLMFDVCALGVDRLIRFLH